MGRSRGTGRMYVSGWFMLMHDRNQYDIVKQLSSDEKFCCCSVTQSCPTLCDPMNYSMPGFPVLHFLPEFAQTHVHWISDGFQPSHSLSPPSPPAFSLSQQQGLFQWVSFLYQVAKVLELQLQHQSCQTNPFRVDFLQDWIDGNFKYDGQDKTDWKVKL